METDNRLSKESQNFDDFDFLSDAAVLQQLNFLSKQFSSTLDSYSNPWRRLSIFLN